MKNKKILLVLSLLAMNSLALASCNQTPSTPVSDSTSSSTSTKPSVPSITPSTTPSTSPSVSQPSSDIPSTSTSTSTPDPEPVTKDNEVKDYTLFAHKEGTTRFEAEEVDVSNYVISSDNPTKVVERSDASNGKFLAASTGNTTSNSIFTFKINLDFDAELSMTAAYVQSEKKKANAMDMREAYIYKIDDKDTLSLSSKTTLSAREDVTIWEEFAYDSIVLSKGEHTFSVTIKSNTGLGNPNIDYMDFTFNKIVNNEVSNHTLFVHSEGTTRFEAEEVDVSNYVISNDNPTKVVERSDASNGKFLAASTGDISKNSTFSFKINLDFDAEISMTASYAQTNKWKDKDEDLTKSYTYIIDENRNMMLSSANTILKARTDITKWETFDYTPITLNKGEHAFKVYIAENTSKGNPNIDYFDFKITKMSGEVSEDEKVPSNDFHNSIQYQYINDSDYENVSKYANGVAELSRPKGITLDFEDENISSNNFVLEYADNDEFNNSIIVKNITNKSYTIQNLMLGQKLYWRVASSETMLNSTASHNLQVADKGPRNIFIDGVSNVRDIGGYASSLVTNGKIKQGLYYRGANLNSITEAGKQEMIRLNIKREIDLRDSYQCQGPYVDGVNYSAISIPSGTESRRFEEFNDEYKQIFALIANADKEPVYLHCTAGADRTGISTFMLLTVCGASYEDMARDYLFTNFSTQGSRVPNYTSEFKQWWSKLDQFEGESKADKAKSWLISKGVTAEQVEKIRSIFVENY